MTKYNEKKTKQLGMPNGTATHRLRKMVMFKLVCETKSNICFRCAKPIETVEAFSMDHKEPWLDSNDPVSMFFNLDNIAFSHNKCNSAAARKYHKRFVSRQAQKNAWNKEYTKRTYTPEKRRARYIETGY